MPIQVRKMTFDDVLKNTPTLDLPIVFEGEHDEVERYLNSQPGFKHKPSRRYLFGGYWYNRDELTTLLPT